MLTARYFLYMVCLWLPYVLLIACQWLGSFAFISDLFRIWLWLVHAIFMTCSCVAWYLFTIFLLPITSSKLFISIMTCSQIVHIFQEFVYAIFNACLCLVFAFLFSKYISYVLIASAWEKKLWERLMYVFFRSASSSITRVGRN